VTGAFKSAAGDGHERRRNTNAPEVIAKPLRIKTQSGIDSRRISQQWANTISGLAAGRYTEAGG